MAFKKRVNDIRNKGDPIKDTWEMKGVVLETKKMDGHHSSENMSHELESTRKAWNLPQPWPCLTTLQTKLRHFRF
jgi:hypothetical protein